MPAAAVIPALVAYIKVVAVKKLVVELEVHLTGLSNDCACMRVLDCGSGCMHFTVCTAIRTQRLL